MTGLRALRGPLLRWYGRYARDLPWRRTRDPYAVWVSEIMLQQTQVATVVPYYERFLERFPDVAALATAPEEEVLAAWSGLGYYRRARALHAAAQRIVDEHGGRLPETAEELRALPGIGRYTAGAIASIAFDRAEPILDGNVRRVLSRLLARNDERLLWDAAAGLARGRNPGKLNQGLMELGALICTPAAPGCTRCPWRSGCAAYAAGRPTDFPAARPRPQTRSATVAVAWVERAGRVLLERPSERSPLRGSWDLPAVEIDGAATGAEELQRRLAAAGLSASVEPPVAELRHAIMNRRLTLQVYPCRLQRGRVAGRDSLRWVRPHDLPGTAHSGATRKVIALLRRGTMPAGSDGRKP
jgi:A/G-specific adenine glycosylase